MKISLITFYEDSFLLVPAALSILHMHTHIHDI